MTVQELIDNIKTLPSNYKVLVLSDAQCSNERPSFYDLDYLEGNDVDEDWQTETVTILHTKKEGGRPRL
jgi:hypothetical protein